MGNVWGGQRPDALRVKIQCPTHNNVAPQIFKIIKAGQPKI